jgi:hypothetical protein
MSKFTHPIFTLKPGITILMMSSKKVRACVQILTQEEEKIIR